MIDLPSIPTLGRDDKIYGIIGRALVFATNFEVHCKVLQGVMEMKKGLDRPNKQAIENFCKKVEKQQLYQGINVINKELKDGISAIDDHVTAHLAKCLNKLLKEKLRVARKARNDIAHVVGMKIEHFAEDDEWREKLIKEVETLVRKIAEADVYVYDLSQLLTNEPTFMGDYCEAAVKWVCEEYEE